MVVVSVVPEIALEGMPLYAGGLGVLEGDKFYGASRRGLDYMVIGILYKGGYVDYIISENGYVIAVEQKFAKHIEDFMKPLSEFSIVVRGEKAFVRPWIYELGSAKTVLLEFTCPSWIRAVMERVYIEKQDDERYYKWIAFAKAAAEFLRRWVGLDRIEVIDLQEAYTALLVLAMPDFDRFRFITHTPGPWGHPIFPTRILEQEFGVKLPGEHVMLTKLAISKAKKVYAVSRKHYEVTAKLFPESAGKLAYVTNGVDPQRWMSEEIAKLVNEGKLSVETFWPVHLNLKARLLEFIRNYKKDLEIDAALKTPIVLWSRRLVRYKRPYFMIRFIENHADKVNALFVLGGKPHPADREGLEYFKKFAELHRRYQNVVFIYDYSVDNAKTLLQGSDIHVFTPFPGWEACGTSFMKAALNGVPTLSSRDGGALELIVDGFNGWFFGLDVNDFINIYTDHKAVEIDEVEYKEFEAKLVKVIQMYGSEEFKNIAVNAIKSALSRFTIDRVLDEYYDGHHSKH